MEYGVKHMADLRDDAMERILRRYEIAMHKVTQRATEALGKVDERIRETRKEREEEDLEQSLEEELMSQGQGPMDVDERLDLQRRLTQLGMERDHAMRQLDEITQKHEETERQLRLSQGALNDLQRATDEIRRNSETQVQLAVDQALRKLQTQYEKAAGEFGEATKKQAMEEAQGIIEANQEELRKFAAEHLERALSERETQMEQERQQMEQERQRMRLEIQRRASASKARRRTVGTRQRRVQSLARTQMERKAGLAVRRALHGAEARHQAEQQQLQVQHQATAQQLQHITQQALHERAQFQEMMTRMGVYSNVVNDEIRRLNSALETARGTRDAAQLEIELNRQREQFQDTMTRVAAYSNVVNDEIRRLNDVIEGLKVQLLSTAKQSGDTEQLERELIEAQIREAQLQTQVKELENAQQQYAKLQTQMEEQGQQHDPVPGEEMDVGEQGEGGGMDEDLYRPQLRFI